MVFRKTNRLEEIRSVVQTSREPIEDSVLEKELLLLDEGGCRLL